MASQLARRYCQTFSSGFNSGRIQLGTVGGKGQKRDVVGNGQGFAAVPTGSVEDQDGVSARRHRACDFGEMGVHRVGVDERKDETSGCAAARADGAEDVGPLVSGVPWRTGTTAALRPDPGERALLADARVRRENSPPDCFLARLTPGTISRQAFPGRPPGSRPLLVDFHAEVSRVKG